MANFSETYHIAQPEYYFMTLKEYCKSRERRKLLEKTSAKIEKELDLQTFLDRMRFFMTAITGLLTPRQMIFV